MFIEYSEEQTMLHDSAEKYLRDNYSFENRQMTVQQSCGFNAEQWQMFANLGWLAMTFQEDAGGFGGGPALGSINLRWRGAGCRDDGRPLRLH